MVLWYVVGFVGGSTVDSKLSIVDYFSGFISLMRDSHLPTAWYSSVNPSFCNMVVILAFNDGLFWLYGSVLSKLEILAIAYITLSTVLYD